MGEHLDFGDSDGAIGCGGKIDFQFLISRRACKARELNDAEKAVLSNGGSMISPDEMSDELVAEEEVW